MRAKLVEDFTHLRPKSQKEIEKSFYDKYGYSYKSSVKIAKLLNIEAKNIEFKKVPTFVKMIKEWKDINDGTSTNIDKKTIIKRSWMDFYAYYFSYLNFGWSDINRFIRSLHAWNDYWQQNIIIAHNEFTERLNQMYDIIEQVETSEISEGFKPTRDIDKYDELYLLDPEDQLIKMADNEHHLEYLMNFYEMSDDSEEFWEQAFEDGWVRIFMKKNYANGYDLNLHGKDFDRMKKIIIDNFMNRLKHGENKVHIEEMSYPMTPYKTFYLPRDKEKLYDFLYENLKQNEYR